MKIEVDVPDDELEALNFGARERLKLELQTQLGILARMLVTNRLRQEGRRLKEARFGRRA